MISYCVYIDMALRQLTKVEKVNLKTNLTHNINIATIIVHGRGQILLLNNYLQQNLIKTVHAALFSSPFARTGFIPIHCTRTSKL